MNATVTLGRLSPADLASLTALEGSGFPERERWSSRSWHAELQAAGRRGFALREGWETVAAALGSVVLGDAELLRIIVAPSHREHGLARRLLGQVLDWAGEQGASRMLLEVREDNAAARALYRGAGFSQIHRRENYYGPGSHALVMAKPLTGPAGSEAARTEEEA